MEQTNDPGAGQLRSVLAVPAPAAKPSAAKTAIPLIGIDLDPAKPDLSVHLNPWLAVVLLLVPVGLFVGRRRWRDRVKSLEITEAELGIGSGKITLRPNYADRQVAYQIWVELSTRKIGLPIDLENDVVAEIYDSWHTFFAVTRDLIKSIPVSRTSDDSTRQIISLSIRVLNDGLRPHLTLWQARFRAWYERKLKDGDSAYQEPQDLQKEFPRFSELSEDLKTVNEHLIAYRAAMEKLVYGLR